MAKRKKVYCAGAIRGDPSFKAYYKRIIDIATKYVDVWTEISETYTPITSFFNEDERKYKQKIYERDKNWLNKSDAIVAECSGASTGVGYEICYAIYVKKIPALCLFHKNSFPSLMITQNNERHIIPQEYSNDYELELFLKCFLKALIRLSNIDKIIQTYYDLVKSLTKKKYDINILDNMIEETLPSYNDITQKSLLKLSDKKKIDFKDSKVLFEFLFKAIILQKRWTHLRSQRLGNTFISGRKNRIIKLLSSINSQYISEIYDKLNKNELKYTKFAFTKNLRAYRIIGLLDSPITPKYGSTKIKDSVIIQKTVYNDLKIESSYSKRRTTNGLFIVTQYLKDLSQYIQTYGSNSIIEILKESMKSHWFKDIPEIPTQSIDDIVVEELLKKKWAQNLIDYLKEKCKEFYEKHYSSFYRKK